MTESKISTAVIKRLPRYYRHLGELLEVGVERISSKDLSSRMKVTASQIRQDLNHFGGFGQQGYGYNVEYLYNEIGKILGLNKEYNIIIIGAGNLGKAIANYANFERSGFVIKGIFDINEAVVGMKIKDVEIRHIDELDVYTKENNIDIAAITVPKTEAVAIADKLVRLGIKALWNFAHTDLNVPDDVIVESVHLSESLMRISYNIANGKKEE